MKRFGITLLELASLMRATGYLGRCPLATPDIWDYKDIFVIILQTPFRAPMVSNHCQYLHDGSHCLDASCHFCEPRIIPLRN